MAAYGITEDQAKIRLFGLDDNTLLAVAGGDLSSIQGNTDHAMDGNKTSEGNAGTITEDTPNKITEGTADDTKNAPKRAKRSRAVKDTTDIVNAPTMANNDFILTPKEHELPDGIADVIFSAVDSFCKKHNFDSMDKCRQTQWGACCMFIGQSIFKQNRKLLADKPPKNGGFCYDTAKLMQLADIWGHLCGVYGKAPFVDDFANFAGLEESSIYTTHNRTGGEITPARMQLLQKLHGMQERGLAGMIADGRQNPTGALACLNHWHGWTSTKEIIHTTSNGAQNAVALPVFDNSITSLPDNSPKS